MKKRCLHCLGVASLFLVTSHEISADPISTPIENHAPENEEVASGRSMRGSGRQSTPRSSGVRPSGGIQIQGGSKVMVPLHPSQYSRPASGGQEDFSNEEIPIEEESRMTMHEFPDFNLSTETPIVNTGDFVIIHITNIHAQPPTTIYWRWSEDDWQMGGTTFQKIATTPGQIPVSVVVQDASGLYSQSQTIEINVLSQPKQPLPKAQTKAYFDMPPQDEKKPQQPQETDEQTAIDIFGVTDIDKEQVKRLGKELEKSISDLHQLEAYIQADLKIKTDCETQLSMILINSIGADTDEPLKKEQLYRDCLTKVNGKLKQAQVEMENLKKNIDRLNNILQ